MHRIRYLNGPKAAWAALLGALLLSPTCLWGVPADGGEHTFTQPDGTTIVLTLNGDEYFSWHETRTGYVVLRDQADQWWKYAVARTDTAGFRALDARVGQINPASIGLTPKALPDQDLLRALHERRRPPRDDLQSSTDGPARLPNPPLPASGVVRNIVILACFSDQWNGSTVSPSYGRPPSEYEDLFNQVGYTTDGAAGSVKDYYDEVTYGSLSIESIVTAWVLLPQNQAYYGANDGSGDDLAPQQMVIDAIAAADAAGLDFSSGDGDGDGWVDMLTIMHSGLDESWTGNPSEAIWSHRWAIQDQTVDGVTMSDYSTNPALRYDTTSITRIGVICHELGHVFGLPDLYDYSGTTSGAGKWCLMASGSWGAAYVGGMPTAHRPVHLSAWCKQELGLVQLTEVHSSNAVSLDQVETNAAVHVLRDGAANDEYFLIENRQDVGFDSDISLSASPGILIWHVDNGSNNNDLNNNDHPVVKLEEADANNSLGSRASPIQAGDSWRSGNGIVGGFQDQTDFASANSMLYQLGSPYERFDNSAYYTYNRLTGFSASGPTMGYHAQTLLATLADQTVSTGSYTVSWPACTNATLYELQEGAATIVTSFSDGAESETAMHSDWQVIGDEHRTSDGQYTGSYSYVFQHQGPQQMVLKRTFKLTGATTIVFYYQSRILDPGYLRLQISADDGTTWATLGTYNGNVDWSHVTITNAELLSAVPLSSTCIVRLDWGYHNMGWSTFPPWGVAIDDFQILDMEMAETVWTTLSNSIATTSFDITGRSPGEYPYHVRAYANSAWQEFSPPAYVTVASQGVVATPTFDPVAGEYPGSVTVAISCLTDGATIHYTTDGSEPTGGSSVYVGPMPFTSDTTLKAKGFKDGWTDSQTATATYTVPPQQTVLLRILNTGGMVGGAVSVPLEVERFTGIGAITLRIGYSESVLLHTGVTSSVTGVSFVSSATDGVISIAWADLTAVNPINLGDGLLLHLEFTVLGNPSDTSPIDIETGTELADASGNPLGLELFPGTFSVTQGFDISGAVSSCQVGLGVPDVQLSLSGDTTGTVASAADGGYTFLGVHGDSLTVTPSKTTDLGGVNATDALKVVRHTAGIEPFPLQCQLVAGDVNGSGAVNATDALLIVRHTAGIAPLPAPSWRFLPAHRQYTPLASSLVAEDYEAIRMGDVNHSWQPDPGGAKPAVAADVVEIVLRGLVAATGDHVRVPIEFRGEAKIGALSLSLSYPSDMLSFRGIDEGSGAFRPIVGHQEGLIKIAWADMTGAAPAEAGPGTEIRLQFVAKGRVGQGKIRFLAETELADASGEVIPAGLSEASVTIDPSPGSHRLAQNYPNPFNAETSIRYHLRTRSRVDVSVLDVAGRTIVTLVDGIQSPGPRTIVWNGRDTDGRDMATGVYLCRLLVDGHTEIRKMTLLR